MHIKKKFYLIIKILIYLPLIVLILLIRPIIFIKFYIISLDRIGNIVHPDMFLINKDKRSFNILLISSRQNNQTLIEILNKRVKLLLINESLSEVLGFLSRKNNLIRSHIYEKYNFQSFNFVNKKRNFYLSNEQKIFAEKTLKENFGKDFLKKRIICFTTRDSKYLKNKYPNKNFKYHNYRDMNADNIIPAIRFLIKKGFFVIRMGRIAEKKINYKNKYFFDYPFSKFKNDLLDIYLAEKAFYWFGSNCGLDTLRWIFRKPVAVFNMAPFALLPFNYKNIVIIPKKYKKNGKQLNLNEIFNHSIASASTSQEFVKKKIIVIENSNEEILELVKFVINFEKNLKLSKNQKKINQKFSKNFIKLVKKFRFENYQVEGNKNLLKNIALINPNFIKKNFN